MSEMDEKLNTLLSDPSSMAQIMQLAQQLSGTLGGAEKSAPEPPPPPPEPFEEPPPPEPPVLNFGTVSSTVAKAIRTRHCA